MAAGCQCFWLEVAVCHYVRTPRVCERHLPKRMARFATVKFATVGKTLAGRTLGFGKVSMTSSRHVDRGVH